MNLLSQLEAVIGKEFFAEGDATIDFSTILKQEPQANANMITELQLDLVA